MIVKILDTKNIDMQLHKVKAHVGNMLNDLADKAAKEGAKGKEVISVNVKETQGMLLRPTWNNIAIETPIRSFLKILTQTFQKAEWVFAHNTKDYSSKENRKARLENF